MGRLIDANALEAEIHAALRDADDINGAYILNTLDAQKTVESVSIKAISAWLAAYAAPPNYALEAICNDIDPASIVYTENDRAMAWEYHWKHLVECGLMEVDDADKT